jgi:hypothetical protein
MNEFAKRYLLARFPSGGVAIDLESGNYYRLNSSAALVCDALRGGTDPEKRVAAELEISQSEASGLVADVVLQLAASPFRTSPQGSYHFYPSEQGYILRHRDRTVLEVSKAGLRISLPAGSVAPASGQLELYVRALGPKLLFQRGITVLHAAACTAAGKLVAFAGVSGAGKTTTAHAFQAAGASLISEDLVVFAPDRSGPDVLLEAESFLAGWARTVCRALSATEDRSASSEDIVEVVAGPTRQLDRIVFLDRARRTGTSLATRTLEEPEALVALMEHDFLGATDANEWRRYFESAVVLSGAIEAQEGSAPNGVEHLVLAAARYMSTWTS